LIRNDVHIKCAQSFVTDNLSVPYAGAGPVFGVRDDTNLYT